jgi:hypothetical protein
VNAVTLNAEWQVVGAANPRDLHSVYLSYAAYCAVVGVAALDEDKWRKLSGAASQWPTANVYYGANYESRGNGRTRSVYLTVA